jgi:hypothetical protein
MQNTFFVDELLLQTAFSVIFDFEHFDGTDDRIFGSFKDLTSNDEFVQDSINFVEVEHNIKFTDVSKVLIQSFDKQMNQLTLTKTYFKMQKFIIIDVDTECKIESSISFVYNFEVMKLRIKRKVYLKEIGLFGISHDDHSVNLGLKFDFFGLFVVHEPFADSCSALTILEQDEADLNHRLITIF